MAGVFGPVKVRYSKERDARVAAREEALAAKAPRFVHRGMYDYVVLTYQTSGTVAIAERDGRLVRPEVRVTVKAKTVRPKVKAAGR